MDVCLKISHLNHFCEHFYCVKVEKFLTLCVCVCYSLFDESVRITIDNNHTNRFRKYKWTEYQ